MNWLIFFVGVLIGWLVELLIDFVFWRRRYQGSASEARLRIELAGLEAKNSQLESQLVGCQEIREQYATRTVELQACMRALQHLEIQTSAAEDEAGMGFEAEAEPDAPSPASPEAGPAAQESGDQVPETKSVEPEVEVAERSAPAIDVVEIVPDDLRKIEGIGPKIAGILNDHGILTFAQLAETDVARLQEILEVAGSRYALADPSTWPEQARLAAQGDWAIFETFLSQLKGGRRMPQ